MIVLCLEADRYKIVSLMQILCIREKRCQRHVLDRRMEAVDTPYGKVHRKVSTGYGVQRTKYEYNDLVRIARENNIGLSEVMEKISQSE